MMQSTISYPGHKKQRTFQQPQPPPGVSEGGNWGSVKHCGDKTVRLCVFLCLFAGVCTRCGLRAYGCPQDEKDAYQVNGQVSV